MFRLQSVRTYLLPTVVLAALVTVSGCARHGPPKAPVIKRPVIRMPSPNAFDYFTSAGKSVKNAGAVDQAAFTDSRFVYSIQQKAKLVGRNQVALKKLREGLRYEYRQPFNYGPDVPCPEYAQFRNLARLLRLEAQVKAARGDWVGAVSASQDGLMMGELIAHGDEIGQLTRIACQSIVRSSIWNAIPRLTAAQAKAAARRMAGIEKKRFPLDDTLRLERDGNLLWFQDLFTGKSKGPYINDWPKRPDYTKAKLMNDYSAFMDQCIRNVRLPYASKPVFPEVKQSRNPLMAAADLPADIMMAIVTTMVDRMWFSDVLCQTRNGLLTATLALQAYREDHGGYPQKLSDLAPDYLGKVPDDLFALKGPLRYRRDRVRYVLWSVGPDGKDDGGKPVADPKAKANAPLTDRYRVEPESKGDIVAGIN